MTKLTLEEIKDMLSVINITQMAKESGIPYVTLTRMAKGSVENPSYHIVMAVGEYLEKRFAAVAKSE